MVTANITYVRSAVVTDPKRTNKYTTISTVHGSTELDSTPAGKWEGGGGGGGGGGWSPHQLVSRRLHTSW